ncbi:GTP cyclohydrolase FolE2 [Azomonas macrocytogenes]|uniref:GTP cyclohydrolase FolE2 n=1 Tax=Azomonas macrocytogenes TaxID=69962 RepID=A0A839T2W8_AZOMA|nr:GTP cyclohydrolase FolE2 [Azomonas macrocytogenes]MBB3102315.1 GTP cyclohydrolase I [Azomonas macrocytogenes]
MNLIALPDIASQTHSPQAVTLPWVGMRNIALPVILAGRSVAAFVDAGVSLDDPAARGIHMSRLYMALEALEQQPLTPTLIESVLQHFLATHAGLSQWAFLAIRGAALLKRPALISPLSGWKSYPFGINARLDATGLRIELKADIDYSSTCPCSAALARQAIQQRFVEDFSGKPLQETELLAWLGSEQGIVATPHSQRSVASLSIRLAAGQTEIPLADLLDSAERALGTPVQTAVKRADEQAFALANGQNPMFCEDAARRLHQALSEFGAIQAFHIRVVHAESLHAHDAVAESTWNWNQADC